MAVKVTDTQDVERTIPEVVEVGEYVRSKVNEEKDRATQVEASLQSSISQESERAQGEESAISAALNKEISDRQKAVQDEAEARASADSALSQSIQEESQRAEQIEQGLRTDVDSKLNKVSSTSTNPQVYAKSADGQQQMVNFGPDLVLGGLVQRDGSNQIKVPGPVSDSDAANKGYIDSSVEAESSRALAAESTLQGNIDSEKDRAIEAESSLQESISKEKQDRISAVATLTSRVAAEELARQQGDSENKTKIEQEVSRATQQEEELRSSISAEESRATQVETSISSRVIGIENKIPAQASQSNQLADKNFVNEQITKSAANRVAYNQAGDPFPTRNALLTATTFYRGGSAYTPNDHDYALVVADEGAPSPFTGGQTRFEWTGSTWEYAYGINERPFTSEEQAAIDSGITEEKVQEIGRKLDKSSSSNSLYGTDSAGSQVMIPRSDFATSSQGTKADTAYQKPSAGIPKSDLVAGVQSSLSKADSAYQKPASGIPKTDLDSSVGASISKADTAYQKPSTGIPESDLSSSVNQSLDRADSAYQKPSSGIPDSDLDSSVRSSLSKANSAYQKPSSGIPKEDLSSGVQTSLSKADSAFQTSEGDIVPVKNGGTGSTSLETVKVGSAGTADSAVADGEGNEIPKTYAKATIVPVRYNGGYWSSYGGQSAKAGDLALIINNTGSTAYQKGCLYKVSSASGSSMSLSPTKIADFVSSRAVYDESGNSKIESQFSDIFDYLSYQVVSNDKIRSYIAFNDENPAELFGGTWEDFSYTVPLMSSFYIDFTGKSYSYNLNGAFNTPKACALICINCVGADEKARGIWAYTPNAGNNYQNKQLTEISVTNGYSGDTISVSVNRGIGNVLSINTSFSSRWRLTVIPLQAMDQLMVLWKRLSD